MREMRPIADDCQTVWARTPVNTKWSSLTPARSPNPACSVVPRMPMKMRGNEKSAMIRCRSRRSLAKSRCARTRIADASLTGLAHDLEIRVLEARRVRLDNGERRLDRAEERLHCVPVELHLEGRPVDRHVAEPGELVAQSASLARVDEHVVLDEIALDVGRRPERHHARAVEDAEAMGMLRLLPAVCR